MTIAELKAKFKTGLIPTETDFSNLIDMIPNNNNGGDIDLNDPAKPYLNGIRIVIDFIDSCTYIAIIVPDDDSMQYFTIPVAFRSYSSVIGDEAFLFQASYDKEAERVANTIVNDSGALKEKLENRDWVSISLSENTVLEPYVIAIGDTCYVINRVYQNKIIRCTTIQQLDSKSSALYIVNEWSLLTQADWVKLKNAIENGTISSNNDLLTTFLTNRCKQV